MTALPAPITVPSRSQPGVEYRVWLTDGSWRCDCAGFYYRGYCRHAATMPPPPLEDPLSITAIQRTTPAAVEPVNRAAILPEPDNWRMMLSMSETLKASGLLPRHIASPAAAAAIILQGWELGIGPMQALNSIFFIDGKLTISSSLMAALIYQKAGHDAFRIVESTADHCVIEYRRPGWKEPGRVEWTTAMAQAAGLAGKDNWRKYPAAMLQARCISAMARAGFADVILGLYSPEELGAPVRVTETGEVVAVLAEGHSSPPPAPITAEVIAGKPTPETRRPVPPAPPPATNMSQWWSAVRGAGWSPDDIQNAANGRYGRPVQNLDADQLAELRDAATSGRLRANSEGVWEIVDLPGMEEEASIDDSGF